MALACACASIVLCASPADAKGADPAEVARALSVAPDGLLMYAPAAFATANGGRTNVDFIAGVYAESAGRVHLLSYDRITKAFRQEMSFETASILGIALVSGPLGRKQLQIQTETGVIACEIGGIFDSGQVTKQAYDRLLAAGVHTFDPPGWVDPVVIRQPAPIVIYVPAHR